MFPLPLAEGLFSLAADRMCRTLTLSGTLDADGALLGDGEVSLGWARAARVTYDAADTALDGSGSSIVGRANGGGGMPPQHAAVLRVRN